MARFSKEKGSSTTGPPNEIPDKKEKAMSDTRKIDDSELEAISGAAIRDVGDDPPNHPPTSELKITG